MSPRLPREEWYHSRESATIDRYRQAQETTRGGCEEVGRREVGG